MGPPNPCYKRTTPLSSIFLPPHRSQYLEQPHRFLSFISRPRFRQQPTLAAPLSIDISLVEASTGKESLPHFHIPESTAHRTLKSKHTNYPIISLLVFYFQVIYWVIFGGFLFRSSHHLEELEEYFWSSWNLRLVFMMNFDAYMLVCLEFKVPLYAWSNSFARVIGLKKCRFGQLESQPKVPQIFPKLEDPDTTTAVDRWEQTGHSRLSGKGSTPSREACRLSTLGS